MPVTEAYFRLTVRPAKPRETRDSVVLTAASPALMETKMGKATSGRRNVRRLEGSASCFAHHHLSHCNLLSFWERQIFLTEQTEE